MYDIVVPEDEENSMDDDMNEIPCSICNSRYCCGPGCLQCHKQPVERPNHKAIQRAKRREARYFNQFFSTRIRCIPNSFISIGQTLMAVPFVAGQT
jgi:hypothetical protein